MKRARDYRQEAWGLFKENDANGSRWLNAILAFVVVYLILGAVSFTAIGSLILSGPLILGLSDLLIRMRRNETWSFGALFDGFNNFGTVFALHFLNSLFIALWSLLLVVPGIIKALSYSMSMFILRDNPTISQSEARMRSIEMMNGNKGRLFCLQLSFIGWIILCGLTFGILTLWIAPVMKAANIAFYEDIKAKNQPQH